MNTVNFYREREAAAWSTFLKTGTSDDLRTWAKELRKLNDEFQHRLVTLQTSAAQPR